MAASYCARRRGLEPSRPEDLSCLLTATSPSSPQPQRQRALCGWGILCAECGEHVPDSGRATHQVGPPSGPQSPTPPSSLELRGSPNILLKTLAFFPGPGLWDLEEMLLVPHHTLFSQLL